MSDDAGRVKAERAAAATRRNRSERREQRRAELVDAASEAIRKYGPDVAMDDIATEAGVSKPILYRHFADKADLYMAVSEHATQCMRTALLSGLETEGDPRELLRLVIDTYLTFIEEQPELYRFVVRRSFPDRPVQRDPVTTNAGLIAGAIARIFGEKLRGLGMEPARAEIWAHAGVGMVQAAADWWLEQRTLSRDDLRDYLLLMVWGALDGILQASR
jgi:AcrR family transcriptional regulator